MTYSNEKKYSYSYFYTTFVFLLLLAEMLAISFQLDALTLPVDNYLSWLLSKSGFILKWLITSSTVLLLLMFFFYKEDVRKLFLLKEKPAWYFWALHLCVFSVFFYLSFEIFESEIYINEILVLFWLSLIVLNLLTWCRLLVRYSSLLRLVRERLLLLIVALLLGSVIFSIILLSGILWQPLSLLTLTGSALVLSLLFDGVYVDSPNKLLGLNSFIVHVAAPCSGLEGIIVSTSVAVIFLYVQRKNLLFPVSFLFIPMATILSMILNILRIVILMVIGSYVSADMALGGFHSVAGWISAAIVAFLIIFCISSMKIFYRHNPNPVGKFVEQSDGELSWAMLVPFVVTLFAALFARIFYQDFDYFYPLKVITGGLALLYFWKIYQLPFPSKKIEPILAGLFIAVFWTILVPQDANYNQTFIAGLESMPLSLMIVWLVFRFAGFWLIAPIVEELVFRGYLVSRLSRKKAVIENNLDFSWVATILSSAFFGLVHGSFIAGFFAGIVFMIVRYRSKSLSEPILAHMVANIALSIWALVTGQWVVL